MKWWVKLIIVVVLLGSLFGWLYSVLDTSPFISVLQNALSIFGNGTHFSHIVTRLSSSVALVFSYSWLSTYILIMLGLGAFSAVVYFVFRPDD